MENQLDFGFDFTTREDDQDAGGVSLPPSMHQDPLVSFANTVQPYPFGTMMPQDGDLSLQSLDRHSGAPPNLEGRLNNVMLAYDPNSTSLQMGLDVNYPYAPTTYPTTSMGMNPIDQSQLHPSYSPFASLPPQQQYLPPQHQSQQPQQQQQQQQQQPTQPQPQPRNVPPNLDPYNTSTNSTGSFDDSDLSRAGDKSQPRGSRTMQERARQPPYEPPATYRPLQPVAIQPKKPTLVKRKCCVASCKGSIPVR